MSDEELRSALVERRAKRALQCQSAAMLVVSASGTVEREQPLVVYGKFGPYLHAEVDDVQREVQHRLRAFLDRAIALSFLAVRGSYHCRRQLEHAHIQLHDGTPLIGVTCTVPPVPIAIGVEPDFKDRLRRYMSFQFASAWLPTTCERVVASLQPELDDDVRLIRGWSAMQSFVSAVHEEFRANRRPSLGRDDDARFWPIATSLASNDAKDDEQKYLRARKTRNDAAHEVSSAGNALAADDTLMLLRKYLGLYLAQHAR